jgi:hypothetical protein
LTPTPTFYPAVLDKEPEKALNYLITDVRSHTQIKQQTQ